MSAKLRKICSHVTLRWANDNVVPPEAHVGLTLAVASAKKAARQQFFDTISTIEINKKLDVSCL
jgi:hypothetical protein